VIKERILAHYATFQQKRIELIDSSEIVAHAVEKQLEKNNLVNKNGAGAKHFYVSDYTESFSTNAKLFFGEDISLEHYPLWD
jgi:glutamate racemase